MPDLTDVDDDFDSDYDFESDDDSHSEEGRLCPGPQLYHSPLGVGAGSTTRPDLTHDKTPRSDTQSENDFIDFKVKGFTEPFKVGRQLPPEQNEKFSTIIRKHI